EYVTARTGATVMALVSLRVFMPPAFDAVSYGCGLMGVPLHWFLLATALGEVPKVGSFTYIHRSRRGRRGGLAHCVGAARAGAGSDRPPDRTLAPANRYGLTGGVPDD